MRREAKRIPRSKIHDPGGARDKSNKDLSLLSTGLAPGRVRANSSDIAEERGPLEYPAAGKSEGKILRPQYKEILRGLSFTYVSRFIELIAGITRSCELSPLNKPSIRATKS